MNNHVYGIIKAYQDTNLGGRYEGSGPKGYNPPDFIKVSEAYGISTESISSHFELEEKIAMVLDYKGPIVCDVNMDEDCKYEPRIFGWNTPIEDMYPYLPRKEFRKNMFITPVDGWENPSVSNFSGKIKEDNAK
jgi:acetolactate synthase I/II/III large subunit